MNINKKGDDRILKVKSTKCIIPGCGRKRALHPYRLKDGTPRTCIRSTCYMHTKDGKVIHSYTNFTPARREENWRRKGIQLTVEEYDRLLQKQKGGCALRGKSPSEVGRRLAVDHNHRTGKVRGLLCQGCNATLGRIETLMGIHNIFKYLS